jgi:hypothetical protein
MSNLITGTTGLAGSTVKYSGTAKGQVTADGTGAYSITGLGNGVYQVAPQALGFVAVPIHQTVTIAGADVTGVNFTSSAVYSETDSRTSPNTATDAQGTDTYTVQTPSSNSLPVDSRSQGQQVDSRTNPNIPVNSRNTPH